MMPDDFNPNIHDREYWGEEYDEAFDDWCHELDEKVIQAEFGYEPGEFAVYQSHWRSLYDEGLTPRQAWQRALDAHRAARNP